ncbi:NYN domain-containing protein [Microvenator marinus]|jgi:uncharacterized protein (TIGR00288 family)|uniref:NYN domain-containing protein n=1 Tax=Microvenator marinus TaxID=2600177 RepID=A0A5B8XV23_9DELT|nr:NYN domain-containing protein [Microvenator marinus]QED29017.1 NYN domain-containing protein [Microvenator marinus]
MASLPTNPNIAIFCDYENVAIGAKDANYTNLDISLIIERLLDKGTIVVKRAYSDWDTFKQAKKPMHEAAFELIEIPHVSYSGKNSADIRMVVDALDLCYTKPHVNVFVIISGDSDFSPLVSKLRENNKFVIGIGVKSSSSKLLLENCDEYIFYDDLVREKRKSERNAQQKGRQKRETTETQPSNGAPAKEGETNADRAGARQEAVDLVLETVEALFRERDENIWASHVKQVIKRKRPQFSETFYGFRSFNELIEESQTQQLLDIQKDEKSGGYVIIGFGPKA